MRGNRNPLRGRLPKEEKSPSATSNACGTPHTLLDWSALGIVQGVEYVLLLDVERVDVVKNAVVRLSYARLGRGLTGPVLDNRVPRR